ncbi:hypothetical protein EVAR_62216_1 [Eumeta japonica]|uniref:Uncharacterized protein n=1 Tax=Eumeta variegata TaxID=151549 RepID=A0A4C1ZDB6_EUMVA|nr:hypothetical protein EVAR_62216_1 [Eumeta japonica]
MRATESTAGYKAIGAHANASEVCLPRPVHLRPSAQAPEPPGPGGRGPRLRRPPPPTRWDVYLRAVVITTRAAGGGGRRPRAHNNVGATDFKFDTIDTWEGILGVVLGPVVAGLHYALEHVAGGRWRGPSAGDWAAPPAARPLRAGAPRSLQPPGGGSRNPSRPLAGPLPTLPFREPYSYASRHRRVLA